MRTDVTHKPKATTQETTVASLALPDVDIEAEIVQLKNDAGGSEASSPQRPVNRRHAADAKRAEVLQRLLDEGAPLATADLVKRVNASVSLLSPLERRGFIRITRAQTVRNPLGSEIYCTDATAPLESGAIHSVR